MASPPLPAKAMAIELCASVPLPWPADHACVMTKEIGTTPLAPGSGTSRTFNATGRCMSVMPAGHPRDQDEPGHLLVATASGDSAAFEQLYRSTSSRLFGVCLRIISGRGSAARSVSVRRLAGRSSRSAIRPGTASLRGAGSAQADSPPRRFVSWRCSICRVRRHRSRPLLRSCLP